VNKRIVTKKIAIIRQEQTGGDGGAQAIIDLMLQAIGHKTSVAVSLLCRKWESTNPIGKKVIINPAYSNRENKQSSFNAAVKRYLQAHHFDLIQSHERINGCHIFRAGDGVHKVWLQQKAKISNALQRWWLKKSPYHRALLAEEKSMFEGKTLKKVICNSHMVRQEVLEHFDIDSDKVIVIYNGVDRGAYCPVEKNQKLLLREKFGIPKKALVFIFSGSGFERKNLNATIKAFSRLTTSCHLLVVGRDKAQHRYEKLAKRLNCYERITFLGAQKKDDMPTFYQCADVLVLPTLYDPFPNVILEGLSCGLPCITSPHSGAVDIIPAEKCGFIVDPFNIDELATAMASYVDDGKYLQDSQAAHRASAQFSQEQMQEKLLQLYAALMEEE
jgi:UDP-glucose:(heptosyl)LPS alpha-1,3-glucosyltransferase